jgi:hypothetical protein
MLCFSFFYLFLEQKENQNSNSQRKVDSPIEKAIHLKYNYRLANNDAEFKKAKEEVLAERF